MTRLGMVIDISRCTACYCCFAACKDEYWGNDFPPYTAAQPKHGHLWMNLARHERGKFPYVKVAYMPMPCMQCQTAPCIQAATGKAVYRREDGIVVIDPKKAVGQKQLLKSCPYGAIFWNEEKQLPQKCTFCAHRIEEGQVPRCVRACPSECMKFGDLEDPRSEVYALLKTGRAETLHSEWNTGPAVYYLDLYKMTTSFISGAVVLGDSDECAAGARVYITGPGVKSKETTTNAFGNFEFDALGPGDYSVRIEAAGYVSQTLQVSLRHSESLGDIVLKR
jgi:Fe-S-cluster-containing dehydrogenase component